MRFSLCFIGLLACVAILCTPLGAQTTECGPAFDIDRINSTFESGTFEFIEDITMNDLEVRFVASTTLVHNMLIDVESPAGTDLRLAGLAGGNRVDFDLIYSSYGLTNTNASVDLRGNEG